MSFAPSTKVTKSSSKGRRLSGTQQILKTSVQPKRVAIINGNPVQESFAVVEEFPTSNWSPFTPLSVDTPANVTLSIPSSDPVIASCTTKVQFQPKPVTFKDKHDPHGQLPKVEIRKLLTSRPKGPDVARPILADITKMPQVFVQTAPDELEKESSEAAESRVSDRPALLDITNGLLSPESAHYLPLRERSATVVSPSPTQRRKPLAKASRKGIENNLAPKTKLVKSASSKLSSSGAHTQAAPMKRLPGRPRAVSKVSPPKPFSQPPAPESVLTPSCSSSPSLKPMRESVATDSESESDSFYSDESSDDDAKPSASINLFTPHGAGHITSVQPEIVSQFSAIEAADHPEVGTLAVNIPAADAEVFPRPMERAETYVQPEAVPLPLVTELRDEPLSVLTGEHTVENLTSVLKAFAMPPRSPLVNGPLRRFHLPGVVAERVARPHTAFVKAPLASRQRLFDLERSMMTEEARLKLKGFTQRRQDISRQALHDRFTESTSRARRDVFEQQGRFVTAATPEEGLSWIKTRPHPPGPHYSGTLTCPPSTGMLSFVRRMWIRTSMAVSRLVSKLKAMVTPSPAL